MSITFNLGREFQTVTRPDGAAGCPGCGYAACEDAPLDCEACEGYGGDTDAMERYLLDLQDVDGEFNVANANGFFIVREVFNLGSQGEAYGSIETSTAALKVSLYFNPSAGVVEPSESQAVRLTSEGVGLGCKVINQGRSRAQVQRYLSSLARLVEIAQERGAPEILWG